MKKERQKKLLERKKKFKLGSAVFGVYACGISCVLFSYEEMCVCV